MPTTSDPRRRPVRLADLESRHLTLVEAPPELDELVVVDPDGHRVGEVDGLVVDVGDRHARLLVVGSGGILGLGRVRRLVPVDAVVEIADRVRISTSHRAVHLLEPFDAGGDSVAS